MDKAQIKTVKTVGGENHLFQVLLIMDQVVLSTRVVKSLFLVSKIKSRSDFRRNLTMTSKQRSTSLVLAQIIRTVWIDMKSRRYLGLSLATDLLQLKNQIIKCLSGAKMKRKKSSVTMSMRTSKQTRQMNYGVLISRWINSDSLRPKSTTSNRLRRTIVREIE